MQLCFESERKKKEVANKDAFVLSCAFTYVVIFPAVLHFFPWSHGPVSFHSSLKDFHQHSWEGRSAGGKWPQCLLPRNVLISPSLLKDCVATCRILG